MQFLKYENEKIVENAFYFMKNIILITYRENQYIL